MNDEDMPAEIVLPKGVMFNAYPDSIGHNLADIVRMLKMPEFNDVFSLFYILPTIFHSDLDRGFSIIDYDLNEELVSHTDLDDLHKLNIAFTFDLVLNHLSVGSPQFQDLLKQGDKSKYKNFFIDWNEFWRSNGEMGPDGCVIPNPECLDKLFMRKPGLPVLKVRFPDGSDRPYWNTFYQEINYQTINAEELRRSSGTKILSAENAASIAAIVNAALIAKRDINEIDLAEFSDLKDEVLFVVKKNRQYLGQMDLNAQEQKVWDFYDETLSKLSDNGAKLIRLDALAYLHKKPGQTNFFNKPGTWDYLQRLKKIADKYNLTLLPEIHSEYGTGLHAEVADKGFPVYDFFFPGLVIDAIDRGTNRHLLRWINEIREKKITTINMLGCHDGIPVLDLKGKNNTTGLTEGLLSDKEIDAVVDRIMNRGGRVKNLYGPDGKRIAYYQVNATFFSALGEDERKLRLARAIQMFMPGIPQVWYLDLFAGKNDYIAADKGGTGGHKEINRTTLTNSDIEQGLKQTIVRDQLNLMRLRNTSPAFNGEMMVNSTDENKLHISWKYQTSVVTLKANLRDYNFSITHKESTGNEKQMTYNQLA